MGLFHAVIHISYHLIILYWFLITALLPGSVGCDMDMISTWMSNKSLVLKDWCVLCKSMDYLCPFIWSHFKKIEFQSWAFGDLESPFSKFCPRIRPVISLPFCSAFATLFRRSSQIQLTRNECILKGGVFIVKYNFQPLRWRVPLIENRVILGGGVGSIRGRIRFYFGIAALIDRVCVVTRVLIGG